MTKRDLVVASTRHHLARYLKYYPKRQCAPSLIKSRFTYSTYKFTYCTYFLTFWNSLYVYTRGILGCPLQHGLCNMQHEEIVNNQTHKIIWKTAMKSWNTIITFKLRLIADFIQYSEAEVVSGGYLTNCEANNYMLVYTKTADIVEGVPWLVGQTPNILCYLPLSNSGKNGVPVCIRDKRRNHSN